MTENVLFSLSTMSLIFSVGDEATSMFCF